MSGNRLLTAFALLIALLGITVWQWKAREKEDDRPADVTVTLPKVTKGTVDSLDVSIPGKPAIKLVLKDKRWRLTTPVDAAADQNAVETAVSKLSELDVIGVAATKADNYALLELDDAKAAHVVARQKANTIIDLLIGTSRSGNTVVKEKSAVMAALVKGPVKFAFEKDVKDWRDRSVVDVPLDTVKDAVFQSPNGTFLFVSDGKDWKQAPGEKPIADFEGAQVKSILGSATSLTAMDFAAPGVTADSVGVGAAPIATLKIGTSDEKGAQEITLRIGKKQDSSYYLMREGNESIYLVTDFVGERLQPTAAKFAKAAPAAAAAAPSKAPARQMATVTKVK